MLIRPDPLFTALSHSKYIPMTLEENINHKSISGHSLDKLKHYHAEAMFFFASELLMLKEVLPEITDERQKKAALLLMSCSQTGAALLQLASQADCFTTESIMLSRAFMEKITNFCYVSICDEEEYRAFILHPVYKNFHFAGSIKPSETVDFDHLEEDRKARQEKQDSLKAIQVVKEALDLFSDVNPNMNWTRKTLNQRIEALETWGKFLDVFFRLSKIQYYSDASEALHGSLYGCSYGFGAFDPYFDRSMEDEVEKKLFKDSACNLLHLGMLIHETFTLISYSADIKELSEHSYTNRGMALNLYYQILEKEIGSKKNM
jgi:hypothetical protein